MEFKCLFFFFASDFFVFPSDLDEDKIISFSSFFIFSGGDGCQLVIDLVDSDFSNVFQHYYKVVVTWDYKDISFMFKTRHRPFIVSYYSETFLSSPHSP